MRVCNEQTKANALRTNSEDHSMQPLHWHVFPMRTLFGGNIMQKLWLKKKKERKNKMGMISMKKKMFAGNVHRIAQMRQDMHNSTNCNC